MNDGILKNHELKARARNLLLGKYGHIVFIQLAYVLITAYMNELALRTDTGHSVARFILYIIISVIVALLTGVLRFGLTRCYMNMCCGLPFTFLDVFYGFKNDAVRVLKLSALMGVIEFLCLMPSSLMLSAYMKDRTAQNFFIVCVLISAGIIVYCFVWLKLALCNYLLLDFPDKSFSEILKMSAYLMKGHGLKLIYLYAGFVPISLLGLLSFGLGFLWIIPYLQTSLTCFYLNRVSNV